MKSEHIKERVLEASRKKGIMEMKDIIDLTIEETARDIFGEIEKAAPYWNFIQKLKPNYLKDTDK